MVTAKGLPWILRVNDLYVEFWTHDGVARPVNGLTLQVGKGQSVGVVGESGCGKSVTALSVLRILPKAARISGGKIELQLRDGSTRDLTQLSTNSNEMRRIRGGEIAMIFQEPMTAFSPVHTIGNQLCEAILLHTDCDEKEAKERAVESLRSVGIPEPHVRIDEYPFQFSGGMRQRAMIAMALVCNPRILIADEPTTALDVTVQAQVLQLIKQMQSQIGLALYLITHDLGVIAQMVDYVYVMYLGCIVEEGGVDGIFETPLHPYTRDLMRSIPTVSGERKPLSTIGGVVPNAYSIPSGCSFHTRCKDMQGEVCRSERPAPRRFGESHRVSCVLYEDAAR